MVLAWFRFVCFIYFRFIKEVQGGGESDKSGVGGDGDEEGEGEETKEDNKEDIWSNNHNPNLTLTLTLTYYLYYPLPPSQGYYRSLTNRLGLTRLDLTIRTLYLYISIDKLRITAHE